MRLFHLSEDGNIKRFIPRVSKKIWEYKEYVWAINEEMVHNYFFPRACPRICVSSKEAVVLEKWMGSAVLEERKAVVFVSDQWEERLKATTLYQYEFSPANFTEIDAIAGYYVSRMPEVPTAIQKISNCLEMLDSANVELIVTNNQILEEVKAEVVHSIKAFSIIKWDQLKHST